MSIIRHVHEDFLHIEEGLDSPVLRAEIQAVKKRLAANPYPNDLECEGRKGEIFRIRIRHADEELEVEYEVETHDIYLIAIKRRWLKRVLRAIADLMTFAPE